MERPTASDMMPRRDHERDLELDKKIEALRRKNEVLMKRYKEVEEDKKRAEEEGMALQSRKGKADDLTITISKSTTDSRVVVTKPLSSSSPTEKEQQEVECEKNGEGAPSGAGRGQRKQLTVTMTGKKGKRVVSERPEKRPGPADVKSSTDDGQARRAGESAGRGKQATTKRITAAQEEGKLGQLLTEEDPTLWEQCMEPESLHASTDLNIPTSKEEQEEYLNWKKEREKIDRERVARHKNAKGQWRRAWDMDKSENMFSDKSLPDRDWRTSSRGGRGARRGQTRANLDSRGHEKRGKDKGAKNVPAMSSKAKGKDRLTGRARRWEGNEEGERLQNSDTTLEEFLEELDALTDAVEDEHQRCRLSPSADTLSPSDDASGPMGPGALKEGTSTQKKVRFSEELVLRARTSQTTGSQDSSTSAESRSSLKASSLGKNKVEQPQQLIESVKQDGEHTSQNHTGRPSGPPVVQETECSTNGPANDSHPAEKASVSTQEEHDLPVEFAKCNINSTEELIDSGLSVLSLESGEAQTTHCNSSDKAREHGKIV